MTHTAPSDLLPMPSPPQQGREQQPHKPWPTRVIRRAIPIAIPSLMVIVSSAWWTACVLIPNPSAAKRRSLFSLAPLAHSHIFLRPRLFAFMFRHFVVSIDGLVAGRHWTLVASALAHASPVHLFHNVVSMVPLLALAVDPRMGVPLTDLFELLLGSAVVSSLAQAAALGPAGSSAAAVQGHRHTTAVSMGASGMCYALMTYLTLAKPSGFSVTSSWVGLSVPAAGITAGLVARELVMVLVGAGRANYRNEVTGHMAHLAGACFGLVFYWSRSKGLLPRRWRTSRTGGDQSA